VIARGLKGYTPHTLTSGDQLRRALAVTRMTRIAVSKAEFKLEVSAVAAPVFGPGGNVVAALEIQLRDLRSRFLATKAALTVAACSLGRQLATGRPDARLSGWTVPNGSKASTFEPT
jgi:DNA-binding IclR family transcriptional regulator